MASQMKVPRYRAQTSLPKQTGGQMLSAQASPGILGAPGAAQMEMGFMLTTEGLRWGEHLLKIERETEKAGAISTLRQKRNEVTARLLRHDNYVSNWKDKADPERQIQFYEKRQQIEKELMDWMKTNITSKITDKTLQRSVAAQGTADIISTMNTLSPQLQKKYLDFANVKGAEYAQGEKVELAGIPPTKSDGITPNPIYTARWENAQIRIRKIAALGNWSPAQTYKYISNFEGGIQELRLQQDILTAGQKPADLKRLYDKLLSTQHAHEYDKIDPERKLKIIEQVQNDLGRASRRTMIDAIRDENLSNARHIRSQKETFDSVARHILKRRTWDQKPPEQRKGETPPPQITVGDLSRNRMLTPGNRSVLEDMVTGAREIINPARVNVLQDEIYAAVTEKEVNTVEEQIRADVTNRVIGQKGRLELLEDIRKVRGKTPEAKAIIFYRDRLAEAASKYASKSGGRGGTDKTKGGQVSAANIQFHTNLGQGQRPSEAFFNAYRDSVAQSTKQFVAFTMNTIPAKIKKLLPALTDVKGIKTTQDLAEVNTQLTAALTAWQAMARAMRPDRLKNVNWDSYRLTPEDIKKHKLSQDERVTVRQIYAAEVGIKELRKAFSTAMPSGELPPPKEPTGDAKKDQENETTYLEEVQKWVSEKAKEAAENLGLITPDESVSVPMPSPKKAN